VQPTLASDSRPGRRSPVYAASGINATLFANGTPLSIWGDSAPNAHGYHVGTSDQTPDVLYGSGGANVGGPGAATDSATGQVAIGYSDLATDRTQVRLVQPTVDPWFPPGPVLDTPGGQAPDALYPVAMTGRSGGAPGIFVAYLRGTNGFQSRPSVWRVGAARPMVVGKRGGRFPGLAMGSEGRLWAFWFDPDRLRIHAARSNEAATTFGADVVIRPPRGTDSVWTLAGEGGPGGVLDLVALMTKDPQNEDTANYHQRIRPGITLLAKALGNGEVRFTTRDAGAPLATEVTFLGKTKQTGPDGKVVLAGKPGKRAKATARKNGYQPASRRVKVK
jgi:hypothetical protein